MRTKKELIKLLLDNFNDYFESGLCDLATNLYLKDKITEMEHILIKTALRQNKPYMSISNYLGYWWPRGERHPRIKFLNEILEKYGNNYEHT